MSCWKMHESASSMPLRRSKLQETGRSDEKIRTSEVMT